MLLATTLLALLWGLQTGGCSDAHDKHEAATRAVTVTDPGSSGNGKPATSSLIDLAPHGYREKEFFFAGDVAAYEPQGELGEDGKWQVAETTVVPFASRLLVRRPELASNFNGTVIVEWLNVSGGADGDPGFMYNWEEILREGYVWVGVSVQKTGIDGGGGVVSGDDAPPGLKQFDPARYGTLDHPGDRYSYDMYTRAAQIVRGAGKSDVLEGLKPARVIAYGESQSAERMVSYIDGVHPLVHAYDGFFVHSRSTAGAGFGDEFSLPIGGTPNRIRDDIEEPVFQFQTETDVLGFLGYKTARQPDSDRVRTWEVAGTAHADAHILSVAGSQGSTISCENINNGPQHLVIKAALHALQLWLKDGTQPAKAEPLADNKDANGNALGGVRTPAVDVPISTLSGSSSTLDILCSLFGKTVPFSPDKLLQLYPTHDAYVSAVKEAARKAREAGFVLPAEEQTIVAEANAAAVP